ncbi:MAG TPA: amidohydrolase family protein [Terracidiphilus sp.]|jgi:L-fuconolactonase
MRLDAHQHFWKYSAEQYGWITDEMTALRRDYVPVELKPLLSAEGLDGSIAVQARQDAEETRWLLELAEENDFIKGVVGWVDLCSPDVGADLEQLASHPKFVGVRHVLQGEPDEHFMLRVDFKRGIAKLAEFRLTYDLLVYPRHLPVAVRLVREFPHQPFVLDHIAKPMIADGLIEPWDRDIRELAQFDNVWCKVSGMVTEAPWKQWCPADFHPYLDVVLEAFGPDRLMMGSDWPVCTLSGEYAATMGIVREYVLQLDPSQQEDILGGNCAKFYGVK